MNNFERLQIKHRSGELTPLHRQDFLSVAMSDEIDPELKKAIYEGAVHVDPNIERLKRLTPQELYKRTQY